LESKYIDENQRRTTEIKPKKKPKIRVMNVEVSSLSMEDHVDRRAMQEVDKLIVGLGWRAMMAGTLADKVKIDQMFHLNYAMIDVQVKGANLARRFDKRVNKYYEKWSWKIFRKGSKLPITFYGEEGNFLALTGLEISLKPLEVEAANWSRKLLQTELYHKFCEHTDPMVCLIPAKEVVNFFEDKSEKTHNISTTRNAIKTGDSWLSKYFDKQYVENLLNKELKRQLTQREMLKSLGKEE